MQKWIILGDFSEKLKNPAFNFRVLDENTIVWVIFEKTFKIFFENSTKMPYFGLFSKEISKPCVKFSRVLTKNIIVWEIFEKFSKIY